MGRFAAEIDASRMPLLLITWSGAPDDTGELDAFLLELLECWRKADAMDRLLSIVVDACDASPLSAPLRQHQAAWIAQHRPLFEKVVLSVHVCITNPLVRGSLTALKWISSDLERVQPHPKVDGALAAAIVDLEQAGLHLPRVSAPT